MSTDDYTPAKLLDFLREAPGQGVLNPAVARSRASAIEALFSELTEAERADIRLIDAEKLAARAHKIQGSTIRPEVVALYKTRVHEALLDYLAWLDNPKGFSSVAGHALRRDKRAFGSGAANAQEAQALESIALATSERRKDHVVVPLREDVTVYVANLPLDLSEAEADRIARVVKALAVPDGAR